MGVPLGPPHTRIDACESGLRAPGSSKTCLYRRTARDETDISPSSMKEITGEQEVQELLEGTFMVIRLALYCTYI
ncbi:hypothetical protein BT93_E1127 [Corymbia citriodora subsp. variegata]|nr:hypothetical protein BT93_E1127 [Corymbia citriodora subsp. variegata]